MNKEQIKFKKVIKRRKVATGHKQAYKEASKALSNKLRK